LREYARQVFGVPFGADAVVTENRLTVDAFLGDATVEHMFIWRPELDAVLAAGALPHAPWMPFGLGSGCSSRGWLNLRGRKKSHRRLAPSAGEHLKRHQLFVNLLRLMKGGVVSYGTLEEAFARNMPAASRVR
jgi:DEAD/DEAH box helicase domain-containing protein